MRKSERSLLLTINDKAATVILDAAACRKLAGQLNSIMAIRRGLAQARRGAGRPIDEVFARLEHKG